MIKKMEKTARKKAIPTPTIIPMIRPALLLTVGTESIQE
jgi:hypothetical protein